MTGSYDRAITGPLAGRRASALSVAAATQALIDDETWDVRLALLAEDPRLVSIDVAGRCAKQGEDVLAALIERAESVGIEAAGDELPLVQRLARISELEPSEATVGELTDLVQVIQDAAVDWTLPWLFGAVEHVTESPIGRREGLRDAVESLLAEANGCDVTDTRHARELAVSEWESVWEQLWMLTDLATLATACGVVAQVGEWFDGDARVPDWANELASLLTAAEQRGVGTAIDEHHMVLTAREIAADPQAADAARPDVCLQSSLHLWSHFQRTGAVWVLAAGVQTADAAYALTRTGHPNRARCASNLGIQLSAAVNAGIVEPATLAEALELHREAYDLAGPAPGERAALASNLGAQLAEAVNARIRESATLVEAVDLQREAYDLTPQQHPERAWYAAKLGVRLAQAVNAGVHGPEALGEAVARLREAYDLTSHDHPDRALHASDLGARMAEAVSAGVLEPEALAEAVDHLREAYASAPPNHPSRRLHASNLGSALADASRAGVLAIQVLAEAVDLQREACRLTPSGHPDRALYASNLGGRLADAVGGGVLQPATLTEAIDRHREAYDLTARGHPNRAGYASNLGVRLVDAVGSGILPEAALIEAVDLQREAYSLTAGDHPNRATYAFDLGCLLADAASAGVLPAAAIAEAVERLREAHELTPRGHPNHDRCAAGLGAALVTSVNAGIAPPDHLIEALDRHREAYEHTPADHADRARYAAGLGAALVLAVHEGALPPAALVEAVDRQREAVSLTAINHPSRGAYLSDLGVQLGSAVNAGVLGAASVAEEVSGLLDAVWRLARAGVTPTHRRSILDATRGVAATAPLLMAQAVGPGEAARAVEALRGHLAAGMHAPVLRDELASSELTAAYRAAAVRYERAQQRAAEGITGYAAAEPAAAGLAELVEQVRSSDQSLAAFGGRPRLAELCAQLQPGSAGVYLIPGPDESPGVAVVLFSDPLRATSVPLPELSGSDVERRVSSLVHGTADLADLCGWMWRGIIVPLLNGVTEAGDWVLIPTGYTGLLPLHAAGSDAVQQAPDGTELPAGWVDDHVTVRTAPSLLALGLATDAPVADGQLIAIADATDLLFLHADRAVARHFIPEAAPLLEVSPDSVLHALVEARIAVISGHASHSLSEGSGLALGFDLTGPDGTPVPRWLTVDAVERLPLRNREFAVLSSCSSGQIATDLPDEAIGLPSALLGAGFGSVAATLWPVDDRAAFVTLARLLQERVEHPDAPVSAALRSTRRWLRTATRSELFRWLSALQTTTPDLPTPTVGVLRRWWSRSRTLRPMSQPVHWAAYGCTGH